MKEHRAFAWLLYLVLLSLFKTLATLTINLNLRRRDHPVVVEDVVEEAWALPDITLCLITRALIELHRHQCVDLEDDATCEATAYITSTNNESTNGYAQFCVSFETSTLRPRSKNDNTLLEFTWTEVNPLHLDDYFANDAAELREAMVVMNGFDFDKNRDAFYYVPISTAASSVGSSTDMSPTRVVHRRLGHPYTLPPPPMKYDEAGFRATFTTSPLLNYKGNNSRTQFVSCSEWQPSVRAGYDPYLGCPG